MEYFLICFLFVVILVATYDNLSFNRYPRYIVLKKLTELIKKILNFLKNKKNE